MNPLLSSQTNRESLAAMIAWGDVENTNSFYEPHLALQNTSESIGEKEAGKIGAEFPPDPHSAPIAFRSRSLEKTGEMIFLFCQVVIVAGRNHWDRI